MGDRQLKPLVRCLGGPALVRRKGVAISRALEEDLFRSADVLSEGSCRMAMNGTGSYFGSTMIAFSLARVAQYWRGPFDEGARAQFLDAVQGSVRMHLRAMRIAYAEVARKVCDRPLGTANVETRARISGQQLHLDVDLEVPLGVSSASGQS